jgi:hypothetical protein
MKLIPNMDVSVTKPAASNFCGCVFRIGWLAKVGTRVYTGSGRTSLL